MFGAGSRSAKLGPATTPPHGITGTDLRQGLVLGEKSWF